MAGWVKRLAPKHDYMSSIPGVHEAEGENRLPWVILQLLHSHNGFAHTCACTHTPLSNQTYIIQRFFSQKSKQAKQLPAESS